MASANPRKTESLSVERGLDHGQEARGSVEVSSKSLEQTLALLKAGDDTSRFVGLALLKSILDSEPELQKDTDVIAQCWDAIPAKFLDRLLRAGASSKKSKEEAESMVGLAVAVLTVFIKFSTVVQQNDEKFAGRSESLIAALAWSSPDSIIQILQVLLTLAVTHQGSLALLTSENLPKVLGVVSEQSWPLQIAKYAIITAGSQSPGLPNISHYVDRTLSMLISSFEDAPSFTELFECLNSILTASPIPMLSQSPEWLVQMTKLVHKASFSRRAATAAEGRHAIVILTASILHLYPLKAPCLLFSALKNQEASSDAKPVSYLFVRLLLIDIRSTIPTLQAILNSPGYSGCSARMAASYDILSAFIGFLVHSIDSSDEDHHIDEYSTPLLLPPDLFLQLRVDISEVMSLTIEHLRDRFDSSVAGAPGLHPSARFDSTGSSNQPLTISWEWAAGGMSKDPLTLSEIRALALWVREDDNDALRQEAAGIMDVLLSVYATEEDASFRSPVLIALEGIISTPEGVETFLGTEGWEMLAKDLRDVLTGSSTKALSRNSDDGIEIVRVLLGIVESDVTGPAKEDWLTVVGLTSNFNTHEHQASLDLRIAVAQLAVELLVRAPRGLRKRYVTAINSLLEWSRDMLGKEWVESEDKEGLEEVLQGLEDLRLDGS